MPEPREMSSEECLRLLKSGVFGRIALALPSGPHIVPMNYAVVHDLVVFRTTPYSLLGRHGDGATAAFEVDHVDYEYGSGWSVVAHGALRTITDLPTMDGVTSGWSPRPWANGVRNLYLGLRWTELTGRRLGGEIDPRRDLPVDRRAVHR